MIKLSKLANNIIKAVSNETDNIIYFHDVTENKINDLLKKYKDKFNQDNYNKLTGQIPTGIYHTLADIKLISKIKEYTDYINPTKASNIVYIHPDLTKCKSFNNFNHNNITGRDKEIEKILMVLSRKEKRNVMLVGEAGVGKTALVGAVEKRMSTGAVPNNLSGCCIAIMDIPYIITRNKDNPFDTIIKILEAANKDEKTILFIDEIHQLMTNKMNDILKPYLTETIRIIGSTTIDEYHAMISDDKALERRFTIIELNEPSIQQSIEMVKGTKETFERYHKCSIPDHIVTYAVEHGSRFLGHRRNPDKSLDVLDAACTIMNMNEVRTIVPKVDKCSNINDLERDRIALKSIYITAGDRVLNEHYVNLGISNITDIDYEKIVSSLDQEKTLSTIKKSIVYQDEAIKKLLSTINVLKYAKQNIRPLLTAIVIGETGCGKTTTAKELAKHLFGSDKNFINYDLGGLTSEFMITELKGSPPGYVGYSKSGRLIKELRNRPQSVLLFRNIDKCHESIREYLISGIKHGRIVDSAEREVKLNNAVILFSISLTKDEAIAPSKKNVMGFTNLSQNSQTEILSKDMIIKKVGKELHDYSDMIINFNIISEEMLSKIFDINVDKYMEMYGMIKINKKKLKKEILSIAKNGHDIITQLSTKIPKEIIK